MNVFKRIHGFFFLENNCFVPVCAVVLSHSNRSKIVGHSHYSQCILIVIVSTQSDSFYNTMFILWRHCFWRFGCSLLFFRFATLKTHTFISKPTSVSAVLQRRSKQMSWRGQLPSAFVSTCSELTQFCMVFSDMHELLTFKIYSVVV